MGTCLCHGGRSVCSAVERSTRNGTITFGPMSGRLFVVATPIGNLEDITLRALRVLRESAVIAAEDTRRTGRLLAHHGIPTPTLSFHRHNTRTRLPLLIGRLQQGADIALVTDAGTPGVSDPGLELVQACIQERLPVEVVPGPSAPLAAAVLSGFPLDPLTIHGFAPSRSKVREAWLTELALVRHTFTFFETPHRIEATLREMTRSRLGVRQIAVARELTKIHEEVLRGTAADVIGQLTEKRGEFTVIVGPETTDANPEIMASDQEIASDFEASLEEQRHSGAQVLGRRKVIVALARKYGRSPREVYGIVERFKAAVK